MNCDVVVKHKIKEIRKTPTSAHVQNSFIFLGPLLDISSREAHVRGKVTSMRGWDVTVRNNSLNTTIQTYNSKEITLDNGLLTSETHRQIIMYY